MLAGETLEEQDSSPSTSIRQSDSEHDLHNGQPAAEEKPTPLPIAQLLCVYLIQFTEPLSATVIYPFINQFVRETGITNGDEGKTGYYAGIIESAFFMAECSSVVQWGYFSDRYGRRPILLCAPLGLALAMLLFGSSTTFWSLVGSRCLQGIFNGNIGVAKSVIAEMTDSSNRADAYGFMPMIWNLGVTIGPITGGVLSSAGKRWPSTLGRIAYIRTHPYFLPCFVCAVFVLLTFAYAFLTLRETLPSIVNEQNRKNASPESRLLDHADTNNNYGTSSSSTSSLTDSSQSSQQPVNIGFRAVATRPVMTTMLNQTFLTFMDMCNFALLPLMYSTPLEYGGLGMDPFRIGVILGSFGFFNSFFQAIFFARCVRKFGVHKLYTFSFSTLSICFGMYPVTKFFAQRAQGVDNIVMACVFFQLTAQTAISMAYGSMQILIIDCIPPGGSMGVINGIAQMIGSAMRTVAPTFAASLFAFSVGQNLAHGNLVYFILIGMTLAGTCCARLLKAKPETQRGL